ncbi:MAG: PAS domain S-box protein [Deltaproteobacteria bacterium]|nr:PAS domain S-box protein [Deltaproteobacteria bacterium]MBW2595195.1 PAS domain S-box protein [Deltaproteobacteria bacterium]
MKNSRQEQKTVKARVQWLIFFRIAIASFLFGVAAIIQFRMPDSPSLHSIHAIYIIVGITYLLSILYVFLLKSIKNISINVYIQSLLDTLLVTGLVYSTGGIESVYSTLYPLIILYSALFLGKNGAAFVASACSIFYGLLVDLEFYGAIQPIYGGTYQYSVEAGHVFLRICIHVASFYVVALLASFVVEMERKTKALLSEKESAFDQLDILHKSIIESVGSGVMTVDLEGRIKSFNRAAEEITGIPSSGAMDRIIDDIFPDFSGAMSSATERGEGSPVARRFEIGLSSKRDAATLGFSIYPLIDPEGNDIGRIFIFQDLTSIKKMEKEIEKSRRLALMGEMSAALAHELRSPLASISGSIKLLTEDLKLEESDRKLMEIILMGKDQLENLVRDFLLFARPDTRDRCKIDVAGIMDEVLESIRFSPGWNGNVEVVKNLCVQNEIYGNRTEIRQTLWNIVSNAFQAMPEGGTLEIETRLDAGEDNREALEIFVRDTGCGIEEKHMKNVREPFYTTKEKGTGLGLAVVSRIVESHGGTFRIESEPGNGTRCTILLPVAERSS